MAIEAVGKSNPRLYMTTPSFPLIEPVENRPVPPVGKGFSWLTIFIVFLLAAGMSALILYVLTSVRTKELQAIIRDVRLHSSSVVMFTAMHNEMPGDFSQAYKIWGVDGSIYNGNGDGKLQKKSSDIANHPEVGNVFPHLGFSQILPQSYQAPDWDGDCYCDIRVGTHIPSTFKRDIGYNIDVSNITDILPFAENTRYRSYLYAGQVYIDERGRGRLEQGGFPPSVIKILDNKLDDGKPRSGKMLATCPVVGSPPVYGDSAEMIGGKARSCTFLYELTRPKG